MRGGGVLVYEAYQSEALTQCSFLFMNSPKWDWSHALSHRQKLPPQLPLTYLRPLWSLTRRHLRHSRYFLYLPAQTSPIQTDHHPAWRYPLTVAPALLQPPRIVFGCCPGDRWRVDAYDKNNNPLLIRATKSQQLVEACHTPLECASYLGEEKSREIYMTGPSVWRWERAGVLLLSACIRLVLLDTEWDKTVPLQQGHELTQWRVTLRWCEWGHMRVEAAAANGLTWAVDGESASLTQFKWNRPLFGGLYKQRSGHLTQSV